MNADEFLGDLQCKPEVLDRLALTVADNPWTGVVPADVERVVLLGMPAHRFSSAQQGALMLREGPRLGAVGCETGDWSHVDVYLTKTTDYRLLVFAGSPWEPQLSEWTMLRGSTVVGVGGDVPGSQLAVRYPGDEDDDVRLLTEVLVPELIAARAWQAQSR